MLKHVDDEQRGPQRCIADAGDVESYWDRLLALDTLICIQGLESEQTESFCSRVA
jgi:hypothetical protein